MCRFVAYLGQPITLDTLITLPRNSLINQSTDAREFEERLSDDDGWIPVPVNHFVVVREDHTVDVRPVG